MGVIRNSKKLASRDWPEGIPFWEPLDTGDLARAMNVRRAGRLEEWAIPIWESEEELKEFISDIYGSRRAGQGARGGLRRGLRDAGASVALPSKQSRRRGSRHG